jgi:RNA polymerase sigma-70 factor, ECF subfamily
LGLGEKHLIEERDLLRRARLLDEAALATIFDTYFPALYRYFYHHVHQAQVAEDLAAEVFCRMLEQLAKGSGPRNHLRAWLYRVAYNLVVDDSRRRVHRDHDSLEEETACAPGDLQEQTDGSLLRAEARQALMSLTPPQREVIILKFLEGYENQEVARILGTTVGAVKALQHRGLTAMEQALKARQVPGGNGHAV